MIAVPAGERGVLRVFALDLPDADAAAFVTPEGGRASRFQDALAPDNALDLDFIEAFPVDQLPQHGHADLLAYVSTAAIKPTDLAHNAKALRTESGWVVLVWSDALGGTAATLHTATPIRAVATLRMTTAADRPRTAPKMPPPARRAKSRTSNAPSQSVRMRNSITGAALIVMVLIAFALVYIGVPT